MAKESEHGEPAKRKITLSDIARQVNVSTATVSKVLNGRPGVSEETRSTIEMLLERSGYLKSNASQPPTKLIELVVRHLDNIWLLDLLRGAEEASRQHGISIVITKVKDEDELADSWMSEVLERRPMGVIILFAVPSPSVSKRLASRGIPCVFLDPWGNPSNDTLSIRADNWSGSLFATRHLIELGHRRIGIITGPDTAMCSASRFDGYRAALTEAGIPVDDSLIRKGIYQVDSGREQALSLLADRSSNQPTAIVAGNDLQAMGVYDAARLCGLRIPEDLSVVGFDDIQTASYMGPALTTVRQPLEDMAASAVRMILDRREGHQVQETMIFPTSLVIRDSTSKPRD
ncbi:LacI family transcriptional regulator [Bifidobacterium primatium]|uniref:LacI family transcriptional regulator n=1 Tax=Bifidobacterium primatium TaxID=2045438 RepID=A0A2M9HAU1_9BIFI|nr:substrate-binding domain-containing protein [Bifidobacterium primatium]PJM73936.1 LacI family transcriptional regulator [Bifidobacterium primatium]